MRGIWGFSSTVYLIIVVRDKKGYVGFFFFNSQSPDKGLILKQHGKGICYSFPKEQIRNERCIYYVHGNFMYGCSGG